MSAGHNDNINIQVLFRKIIRMWWLFGITLFLAGAWAVWHMKTTPKTFQVDGVMLMSDTKRNNFGGGREDFIRGASYLRSNAGLEDEISLLTSFTNMLNTIQQLDFGVTYLRKKNFLETEIYEYKPFIVRLDTGLQVSGIKIEIRPNFKEGTYRVLAEGKYIHMFNAGLQKPVDDFVTKLDIDQTVKIGEPFRSPHLNFSIEFFPDYVIDEDSQYYFVPASNQDIAAYYRAKTVVTPQSDESNIITISTTGQDTRKERDFINTLMHTYIKSEQDKHNEKGNKTIAFIDDQLNQSTGNLEAAEGNLQNVQASAGSLVGSAGERGAALFNDLSRLKDEQARSRSKLDYLSSLITQMGTDDGGTPVTISAVNVGAQVLNNLIDEYNKDVNELAQKRLVERQQSAPTIALARKVQTERNQIIQSAQDARRGAQIEVDQLSERIRQLEYQLNQLPQSSRQVNIATRKYDITASINTYLMEKRYEAQIAVNSDQVDKYIVDAARVVPGGPISPKKSKTFGFALALGLLLPLGFILVRDLFNDRIMDLDELKRLSPITVLSTVPVAKQVRISPEEGRSALAESFRTIRINLQYLNPNMARQVVGITSSTSGEGKTFCAVNLATVMALGNKRTLLIDADLRKPKVHERFNIEQGVGLSTYLIGESGLDQLIRKTDIPGLDVITSGPIPPNPLELFESPLVGELFNQLRSRYDQIVVDASPMGVVSEFKVLMHHLDLALYVVRQGFTRRAMLRPINELYRADKIKRIDLLLNGVKAEDGYGYVYGSK